MPESLNIEAGSRIDRGLKAYREFLRAYSPENAKKTLKAVPEEAETAYLRQRKDIPSEDWALGKAA